MNNETVNTEIRHFLKKVGIQSHQAIERAIQEGMARGRLNGDEHLNAVVKLHIDGLDLDLQIKGNIALQ